MKLSIAIVNFNGGAKLRRCLDAIRENPPSCSFEVLVVDNASSEGSVDFLEKEPRALVRLFRSKFNFTFTGGYNLAFREAKGELFMILNADLYALPGSFDNLVRHMDEDPGLGAVGGYQCRPDGSFEHYVNRFPRVKDAFLSHFIGGARAEADPGFRRYMMLDEDFSKPQEVPQPAGGCMIMRSALFPEGLMSKELGLFWSDVEISRKVAAKGLRSAVFPDAPFTHDHPRVAKPSTRTTLLIDLDYYVGGARYFGKYDGAGAALKWKALAWTRLLGRLVLIEFPSALRGKQSWSIFRGRIQVLAAFLAGRNLLLEREVRRAREAGVDWPA